MVPGTCPEIPREPGGILVTLLLLCLQVIDMYPLDTMMVELLEVNFFEEGVQERGKEGVTGSCKTVSGEDSKVGAARGPGGKKQFLQGLVTEVLHRATSHGPLRAAKGEEFVLPGHLPDAGCLQTVSCGPLSQDHDLPGRDAGGSGRLPLRLASLEIGIPVSP